MQKVALPLQLSVLGLLRRTSLRLRLCLTTLHSVVLELAACMRCVQLRLLLVQLALPPLQRQLLRRHLSALLAQV
jgi:hypothetical protein